MQICVRAHGGDATAKRNALLPKVRAANHEAGGREGRRGVRPCPACGEDRDRRGPCGWRGDDGPDVAVAGLRARRRPQDGFEGAGVCRDGAKGHDARKGRCGDSGGKRKDGGV